MAGNRGRAAAPRGTGPRADLRALGERLRALRRERGLTLKDVEEATGGEFKVSSLGAYERGERGISLSRLEKLASFYAVPPGYLLFGEKMGGGAASPGGVRVDLERLREASSPLAAALARFVSRIQAMRGDYKARVITVRREDLTALAAFLGEDEAELMQSLSGAGVISEG